MSSAFISWLISVCIIQFLIIVSLISKHRGPGHGVNTNDQHGILSRQRFSVSVSDPVATNSSLALLTSEDNLGTGTGSIISISSNIIDKKSDDEIPPPGVAMTMMLHAPTWFIRRYTIMIQNVIGNIPEDWKVQIFYKPIGQSQKGLDVNPGIKRYIRSGKVILTEIAEHIWEKKRKRFELMTEQWIWENVVAENVFVFGGNAVICSNSPLSLSNFTQFDYIGTPWNFRKGVGGDGGISFRRRSAMLQAIEYQLNKIPETPADAVGGPSDKRALAYKQWGQEDTFFVSSLLEMAEHGAYKGTRALLLAARQDTLRFGAIGAALNDDVFVVSGTLPSVPFEDRQKFISLCPEMKIFYPALHDPSCFGAEPNGEKCAKTVCALKPRAERRGGC